MNYKREVIRMLAKQLAKTANAEMEVLLHTFSAVTLDAGNRLSQNV